MTDILLVWDNNGEGTSVYLLIDLPPEEAELVKGADNTWIGQDEYTDSLKHLNYALLCEPYDGVVDNMKRDGVDSQVLGKYHKYKLGGLPDMMGIRLDTIVKSGECY